MTIIRYASGNIYLEEWLFGAVVSRSGGRLVRGPFHCCQDILLVSRLLDIFAIRYWSGCGDIAKFEIALCADAWKILLSLKGLDSFDSSLSLLSFSKPSCWHNQTSVQCKIINFYFHFQQLFHEATFVIDILNAWKKIPTVDLPEFFCPLVEFWVNSLRALCSCCNQ